MAERYDEYICESYAAVEAGNGLNATISVVPYLEKMFNDSVSSWEGPADDETRLKT